MIGVSVGLTDRDLGLGRAIRSLAGLDGVAIEAGHMDGDTYDGGEITVAGVGLVHEFGSADGKIPQRSWMRSTFDMKRTLWERMVQRAIVRALGGGVGTLFALTAIGEHMASDLRRKITSLRSPPNAAATVAKKRSSNPLIDTGHMRQSVRSRVSR